MNAVFAPIVFGWRKIMNSQAIEDLNTLLKTELSAIETYNKALAKFQNKDKGTVLCECQESHVERANKLRAAITKLNGEPISKIGIGAKLAKLIMDGAKSVGDSAIIMALQADEEQWSADYEWCLVSMHGDHRLLVKDDLLPAQQLTDEKLRELANAVTKGLFPATPGTKDI